MHKSDEEYGAGVPPGQQVVEAVLTDEGGRPE